MIDVSTSAELKIKVFPLKNADATETAKTLNDVFKKETMKAETGNANPMSNIWRMFGAGGGGGGGGGRGDRGEGGAGGPSPRALAHEMVRITAEVRTNSVIVSATEDNMKIIEDLVLRLDDKSAAAIKLKLYALRYADATGVAKLVNDLFAETPTNSQGQRGGANRGGGMPIWMGGAAGGPAADPQGATKEVRAVADTRTNSVLVAASAPRSRRPRTRGGPPAAVRLTAAAPAISAWSRRGAAAAATAAVAQAPEAADCSPARKSRSHQTPGRARLSSKPPRNTSPSSTTS